MHPQTSTEYNKERCFNNQVSFYIYNRSLVVCLILIFQNVSIILVFTVTSGFPQPTASIVVVHKMQTMHRTTYFQWEANGNYTNILCAYLVHSGTKAL